jgi:hypothetical protein
MDSPSNQKLQPKATQATSTDNMHALLLDIAESLGPDISYVRRTQKETHDKLFLTGIEIALAIGAGLVAAFLTGVAKGLAEAYGKNVGAKLSPALESKVTNLRNRVSSLLREDSAHFSQEYDQIEKDLAASQAEFLEYYQASSRTVVDGTSEQQIVEVREELRRFGFVERKAVEHSKQVVECIQRAWPPKK